MKKVLLLLLLGYITTLHAQLTEVYNFGYKGPSSYDFKGDTKERIYQGKFFYYYYDNVTEKTFLYYKDTSTSAPVAVKDITVSVSPLFASTSIMTYKANEKYLYFTTYTGKTSALGINELWRTDGTEAGTVKIKTYEGEPVNFMNIKSVEYSVKSNLAAKNSINGDFIFGSSPTPSTRALWITDGTPEGTIKLIENTVSNTSTAAYSPVEKIGGRMLFTVLGASNYWELWSTDGTAAGTQFHSKLLATYGLLNGKYYFYASLDDYSTNTISYTEDGINVIKKQNNIPVAGIDGYLYNNTELYMGSAVGNAVYHTTNFSDIKKIADIPQTNTYFLEATGEGLLYAKLLDYNISDEYTFYFANRNAGVRPVNSGAVMVSSRNTFAFKNTFYSANTLKTDSQKYGNELWRMDGFHTELLKDIYPGFITFSGYTFPNNAYPKAFFTYNDEMYFLANQANGQKLFKFNPDFTFTNAGNDNKWSNASNWKAGATPMLSDNAIIPTSKNVDVNGAVYVKDLEVSSPINVTSGTVNLAGNLSLNSKLNLDNGNLILKGNTSKIISTNPDNYIATTNNSNVTVENLDTARGSLNLPIGTTNSYLPLSISNNGTADSFSIKVSEGSSLLTSSSINAVWDVSEGTAGGSNVGMTLGWNQSQESTGFLRNSAKIGHYKNGQWIEENSGSVSGTNPYSISASGITSFSPFSVMNFASLANADIKKNTVSIYPNPTSDIVNFSQVMQKVSVFDRSGKLMKTAYGTSKISISELVAGIYILYYTDTNGNRSSEKIIKK